MRTARKRDYRGRVGSVDPNAPVLAAEPAADPEPTAEAAAVATVGERKRALIRLLKNEAGIDRAEGARRAQVGAEAAPFNSGLTANRGG